MSSHLGLLMLLVSDVPRAKAFYTDYLGLEAVPEFSSDEFVLLRSHTGGGTSLALQDVTKETYGVPLAHGGIIAGFEVEDADAIYQQWKSKSVEILGEVTDMGAGRTFTAKDPEGHYIQVFHLYPQVRDMQKQMGMESKRHTHPRRIRNGVHLRFLQRGSGREERSDKIGERMDPRESREKESAR